MLVNKSFYNNVYEILALKKKFSLGSRMEEKTGPLTIMCVFIYSFDVRMRKPLDRRYRQTMRILQTGFFSLKHFFGG